MPAPAASTAAPSAASEAAFSNAATCAGSGAPDVGAEQSGRVVDGLLLGGRHLGGDRRVDHRVRQSVARELRVDQHVAREDSGDLRVGGFEPDLRADREQVVQCRSRLLAEALVEGRSIDPEQCHGGRLPVLLHVDRPSVQHRDDGDSGVAGRGVCLDAAAGGPGDDESEQGERERATGAHA